MEEQLLPLMPEALAAQEEVVVKIIREPQEEPVVQEIRRLHHQAKEIMVAHLILPPEPLPLMLVAAEVQEQLEKMAEHQMVAMVV